MPLKKQGIFAFKHSNQQDDLYKVYSATDIKQKFDSQADELKTTINAIIDQLQAITDADSGADNIKMTAITETGTANTVQSVVEALITKIKAVTDSASGADLVGMTPIAETGTANTVQAVIETLITELKDITDSSSGADLIGATSVATGSGTTVQAILEWLYQEIANVTLGQIPDDSLTNAKLEPDIKVGSLASLTTTDKTSVVAAVNEHLADTSNPHNVTPSAIGAEPSFSKNSAFNKNFGTATGTVAEGTIRKNGATPFVVHKVTADPSSEVGQIWLRTDL